MLYCLETKSKMNLPSILFKYLREMIRDTRNGATKPRKWIPLGRIISDVLVESQLVKALENVQLSEDLKAELGNPFNGKTLKNMQMISETVEPKEIT